MCNSIGPARRTEGGTFLRNWAMCLPTFFADQAYRIRHALSRRGEMPLGGCHQGVAASQKLWSEPPFSCSRTK